MNKVILMGRLTRDPEVRYSQQILSAVWHLDVRENLQRNISVRERKSLLREESRPALIRTVRDRKSIRQM